MEVSFFLALKFLKSANKLVSISWMIKISFFSILIGSLALTLIVSIMNGFEKETYKKLQGLNSDIIITALGESINYEKVKNVIQKEFSDNVLAITPISSAHVIIQNTKLRKELNNLIIIKGINPVTYSHVNKLEDMILDKKNYSLDNILQKNSIIIGQTLADNLCLKVGDTLKLLIPDDNVENNKISFYAQEIKVGGIFKTGIYEYDENIIFSGLKFFKKVFNIGITQIDLKLKDNIDEKKVKKSLKKRLSLNVSTWKDLYPTILSALNLEKLGMLIILILVTIINSINIIALLFMIINQKRGQIAILRSMGLSDKSITRVFIYLGIIITFFATVIGVFFGWLFNFFLNKYKFIKLPDIYYVDYLPSQMDWLTTLFLILFIIFVSFLASLIPTLKIKDINIAQILKNELS